MSAIVELKQICFQTGIPENFFRNFKRLIYKEIRATGEKNYVNKLQKLLLIHNSRKNRSLGMSPLEAVKKENWSVIYKRLYSNRWNKGSSRFKFRKGQLVKILKLENFTKSFKGFDWSDEIFSICRRSPSRPPTYILKDEHGELIDGAFYAEEIQAVNKRNVMTTSKTKVIKMRKKGKEHLVVDVLSPKHARY